MYINYTIKSVLRNIIVKYKLEKNRGFCVPLHLLSSPWYKVGGIYIYKILEKKDNFSHQELKQGEHLNWPWSLSRTSVGQDGKVSRKRNHMESWREEGIGSQVCLRQRLRLQEGDKAVFRPWGNRNVELKCLDIVPLARCSSGLWMKDPY